MRRSALPLLYRSWPEEEEEEYVPDPMDISEDEEEGEEEGLLLPDAEEEEEPSSPPQQQHLQAARIVLLTYGLTSNGKECPPRFDPVQLVRSLDGVWERTLSVYCLKLAILKNQARMWTRAPCVRPDDYALYMQGRLLNDKEQFYDILRLAGGGVNWGPAGPCIYLVLAPVALPLPRYVHKFKIVVHQPPPGKARIIQVSERLPIWECTLGMLRARYGGADDTAAWRPLGLNHELQSDMSMPAAFFGLNENGIVYVTAQQQQQ